MSLFDFSLTPVGDVTPWGEPGDLSLSWFALSLGEIRVRVGDRALFLDPSYQVAAHARGVLFAMSAAITPLPPLLENLVRDWRLLNDLYRRSWPEDGSFDDRAYNAWRWLGEREPDFPEHVAFLRVGDDMHIRRSPPRRATGASGDEGTGYVLRVSDFVSECRSFGDRLLSSMEQRISEIADGKQQAQITVDVEDLRTQHAGWKSEFATYLARRHEPDITWEETEKAVLSIAREQGLTLELER